MKGTGLGLAIVKKIIEEHGGAIWVDTSRKVGAGFIIQLPVDRRHSLRQNQSTNNMAGNPIDEA